MTSARPGPEPDPDPLAPWRERGGGLVLVRHGRTAWNVEGRFLGERDLPLDDVGRASLRSLDGLRGRFAAVYTSPAARARETAAALGDAAVVVPELAEMRQGELEGLRYPEALARWPEFFEAWNVDPEHVAAPGGESLGAVRTRAEAALHALGDRHRGAWIAVVGHQLAFASVLARLAGDPPRAWRAHRLGHLDAAILAGQPLACVGLLRAAA